MSKHSDAVAAAARELGNPHVIARSGADGFGTGTAPADTAGYNPTGNQAGAPYTSRTDNSNDVEGYQSGLKDNPYNPHDTNEAGVLGGLVNEEAKPMSSPVPSTAGHMPDRFGNYKADAVASVTTATPVGNPVTFPADGVLGRS